MLPEVRIARVDGPWGPIAIAATARGVVAVHWLPGEEAIETALGRRFGSRRDEGDGKEGHGGAADDRLADGRRAVESLLDGRDPGPLPPFDLSDRPAWDRAVLGAVADIPWGRTASYGEIARRVGAPRAARAVGGAVGRNPIGLLIPCHRVIAADGTIGGYGGTAWGSRDDRLAIKRWILGREGVIVRERDEAGVRASGWGASGRPR